MIEAIIAGVVSGAFTGVVTVITLRADVRWLKEIIATHDSRITFIERNI